MTYKTVGKTGDGKICTNRMLKSFIKINKRLYCKTLEVWYRLM